MKALGKKIFQWEGIAGRTIDEVAVDDKNGTISLFFDEGWVEFESEDPHLFVYLFPYLDDPFDIVKGDAPKVDPQSLKGRVIEKVIVPFLSLGCRDDALVRFTFKDGSSIMLGSEDFLVPIRFS